MTDFAQHQWSAVDRYVNDLVVSSDDLLDEALRASTIAGLPEINVSPCQGKQLQLLAQFGGARRILELGTLGGYSTIWLARALPADGQLITLELEPSYASVAQANIDRAGLTHLVDIRVGPALDTLAELAASGCEPFDLIFIDADKPSYPEYFKRVLKLARKGTLIIADNVVRNGAVADADSKDEKVRGVRTFMELMANDSAIAATVIQTVGTKGYDVFAMALVVDQSKTG